MSENISIGQKVLEAYHASDFLAANWDATKHQVKTDVIPTAVSQDVAGVKNYLVDLFSAGEKALTLNGPLKDEGALTSEQSRRYRQDAINSVATEFAFNYVSSKPEFKDSSEQDIEQAKRIKAALGSILGRDEANGLLLTASFSRMLKRVDREGLINGYKNTEALKQRFAQSKDLNAIGLLEKDTLIERTFNKALNLEIECRRLGTEPEQIRHLTAEFAVNMVVPAIIATIYLIPAAMGLFFNNLILKNESESVNPLLVVSLQSVFTFGGGSGSAALVHHDPLKMKPFALKVLENYLGAVGQYVKTGRVPGTPKMEGSEPSI